MKVIIINDDGTVHFECALTKSQSRQIREFAASLSGSGVVDVTDIVQMFNDTCTSLSSVLKITLKRAKEIQRAAEQYDLGAVFTRVEHSKFLTGHNDRGFKATFDWILKPDNLLKIMEGNYDGKPPKNAEQGSFDVNDLEKRALEKYRRA